MYSTSTVVGFNPAQGTRRPAVVMLEEAGKRPWGSTCVVRLCSGENLVMLYGLQPVGHSNWDVANAVPGIGLWGFLHAGVRNIRWVPNSSRRWGQPILCSVQGASPLFGHQVATKWGQLSSFVWGWDYGTRVSNCSPSDLTCWNVTTAKRNNDLWLCQTQSDQITLSRNVLFLILLDCNFRVYLIC